MIVKFKVGMNFACFFRICERGIACDNSFALCIFVDLIHLGPQISLVGLLLTNGPTPNLLLLLSLSLKRQFIYSLSHHSWLLGIDGEIHTYYTSLMSNMKMIR